MGAARPSAGVAALNGSFVEFDGSGALGHQLPVVVTFRFQEWGRTPIPLSGRFTTANMNPALARHGQELPVASPAWRRRQAGC